MPRSRLRGLTLIEVIAAIAILGTVLVGVVLSKARHTRQIALTRQHAAVVDAADALITGWWTSPEGVPIGGSGTIDGEESLRWETRVVGNPAVEGMGARVVRVEIHPSAADAHRPGRRGEPLVAVDLVLPDPDSVLQATDESAQTPQDAPTDDRARGTSRAGVNRVAPDPRGGGRDE